MLDPLEHTQPVPERVYNRILEYINGDHDTDRLPPETALAEQLRVSRTAVREALQRLEVEGYVVRKRKVGTCIVARNPAVHAGFEVLNSITKIIENAGMSPGTSFLEYKLKPADSFIREKLQLQAGDEVSVLKRVRTADDIPVWYDTGFMPTRYLGEDDVERLGHSLMVYLSKVKGVDVVEALTSFHPYSADKVIAERLGVPEGHLLMLLEQTLSDANRVPIVYSRSFYRSDVIGFHIVRKARGIWR
jgi:GntR family transcriptional regulator